MHDMDTTTSVKNEEEEGKLSEKQKRTSIGASVAPQFGHQKGCV
jgi:hypothetical protein